MKTLRVDDKPGEDTRYLVRSVLLFMTEAFDALERNDEPHMAGTMNGAARILDLCADALKEPDEPAGAADGE
ncbi:MAG: hypothetical protein H6R09_879 [Proteobacteria bacterium]|nr:hypothetical protein [Pseudomonadota bacterium]